MEGRGETLVVGNALLRAFSRARVLAWKRVPDCVYPEEHSLDYRSCKGKARIRYTVKH